VGGLLGKLTKMVVEGALEGEMEISVPQDRDSSFEPAGARPGPTRA
jgi:hypothetical protein